VKLTLVAVLCHSLAGIPEPVCHEALVYKDDDGGMQFCEFSQAIVAQWKEHHPRYASEEWSVNRIKCVFGNYELKDAI
jgi:hypothetical protein